MIHTQHHATTWALCTMIKPEHNDSSRASWHIKSITIQTEHYTTTWPSWYIHGIMLQPVQDDANRASLFNHGNMINPLNSVTSRAALYNISIMTHPNNHDSNSASCYIYALQHNVLWSSCDTRSNLMTYVSSNIIITLTKSLYKQSAIYQRFFSSKMPLSEHRQPPS